MSNTKALRIVILVFGLATSLVHLYLFYGGFSRGQPNYLFLANSLGYLALLAVFFLNVPFFAARRALTHYLFMAGATLSILAWLYVNWYPAYLRGRPIFQPQLSVFDKTIEVLLIAALYLHLRATQRTTQLAAQH